MARNRLPLRPAGQYHELGVELMLGRRVTDLGLERRAVELEGGATIAWDRLCIATGSDARRLPGFEDALYLRELPQAERLRDLIERREPLDIVGAGFIGCEVAAAAVQRGCRVRVYEALEQPLVRVLGSDLGAYVAGVHREHGVELHTDVTAIPRADLVAVGSVPRTHPGLQLDGGIVVDGLGRTSVPDVYAAGDVTCAAPGVRGRARDGRRDIAIRRGAVVLVGSVRPEHPVRRCWTGVRRDGGAGGDRQAALQRLSPA